ncbi:MAG: hypothetical protein ACJAY8_001612 [Sphingobacteriales bacterium]|jgi:hypothetical protein
MKPKFILLSLFSLITCALSAQHNFAATPNPFSDSTVFSVDSLDMDTVSIYVFNRWGTEIGRPIDKEILSGSVLATFHGDTLPNDVYISVLEVNSKKERLNLLKINNPNAVTDLAVGNSGIQLYPNPVRDFLSINSDFEISRLEIFNAEGQMIQSQLGSEKTINTEGLRKGVYLILVYSRGGVVCKRFVKD